MPYPIPSKCEIYIELKEKSPNDEMKTFESYTEFYGLSFLLSGDRKFITPTMIAPIQTKDVGFITKHLPYRAATLSNAPYRRYLIKFKESAITDTLKRLKLNSIDELLPCPVYHFTPEHQEILENLFEKMYLEYEKKEAYYETILVQGLNELLLLIARNRLTNVPSDLMVKDVSRDILEAVYYIETNWNQTITLKNVSAYFGFSESHFSRRFKKETGITFSSYLQSIRLTHAAHLLSHSDKTLEEIAELTHFCDPSYLCHLFREKYGQSPKEYRTKKR